MKNRSGSITGQITINGEPAAGLEVALLQPYHYMLENAVANGRTDKSGRYRLSGIPSGYYWLKVVAPGYVNPNPTGWDEEEGPGKNVSIADGESVEDADLDLILGGVISGRLLDVDGNPVVREPVELTFVDKFGHLETLDLPGEDLFLTDPQGAYRIYGIPPGRYLVSVGVDVANTGATGHIPGSFHPTVQVDDDHYFEQTFYPGVRSRADATAIDIAAGSAVRDVNLTVGKSIPAYSVTGRVIDCESRKPIDHCYIQLGYTYSQCGGYGSSYVMGGPSDTDSNGNFRVEGLLPGRFFVSAQFEGETEFYCTPVEFIIKDADRTGIAIKANRGLTLSGSVTVEGAKIDDVAAKLAQLQLCVTAKRPDDIGHDSRASFVNSDGSFAIRGLPPGSVQLHLGFDEGSRYFSITRIEHDGKTLSDPTAITRRKDCPAAPIPRPRWDFEHPDTGAATLSSPMASTPLPHPSLRAVEPPEAGGTITLSPMPPTQAVPLFDLPPQFPPGDLPPAFFPGGLPPFALGEHGLSGVRLVLLYKNGSIRGHVEIAREQLASHWRLRAGISYHTGKASCSTSTEVDPNGDFFMDGLEPGEYEISILSQTKSVIVSNDSEARVSFVIDPNESMNHN